MIAYISITKRRSGVQKSRFRQFLPFLSGWKEKRRHCGFCALVLVIEVGSKEALSSPLNYSVRARVTIEFMGHDN